MRIGQGPFFDPFAMTFPHSTFRMNLQLRIRFAQSLIWMLMVAGGGCRTLSPVPSPDSVTLNWLSPFNTGDLSAEHSVDIEQLRSPEGASVVHPGDLLEVTVWDLYEPGIPHTSPLKIDEQGQTVPPLLEGVNLGGLTLAESEKLLIDKYRSGELLIEPRVLVRRLETSACTVEVLGGVEHPGTFKLPHDQANVYHALLSAGGVKSNTSTNWMLTRYPSLAVERPPFASGTLTNAGSGQDEKPGSEKNSESVSTLDTAQLRTPTEERSFDISRPQDLQELKRIVLREGDVLRIPESTPPLKISGIVRKPGSYPLSVSGALSIPEAIELSGGLLLPTFPAQAVVTRSIPGGQNVERWSFPIAKGKLPENTPALRPGDSLHIELSPQEQVKRVIGGVRHRIRDAATSSKTSPERRLAPGDASPDEESRIGESESNESLEHRQP